MDIVEVTLTEEDIRVACKKVIQNIKEDNFHPEVIVGLSRGGLIPAQYIAYGMDVKSIESISIQLRDCANKDANSEINNMIEKIVMHYEESNDKANVLVVDDLVDSGETIRLVQAFFQHDKLNVKTATLYQSKELVQNLNFVSKADYYGVEKPEGWLHFPWDTILD